MISDDKMNLYYNKYDVPIIFSKKDKTNKYTTIYMCMLLYNIIYVTCTIHAFDAC